ncbi:hypothetical protein FC19_GL001453 [Liquorilactobacillus aquaticus DSM 21051]|uniref:Transcriptional regulator n=2 Tax=Liquorilactobacillus aquaticus TaxID=392566 RepID=A0A0R2D262_9LACO|nr:hypothetical protein FC19_GL001453 [Liquorilactobacillus aquaticus DSM 21051]
MIRDYPSAEEYIRRREQELMYRYQEFKDENVGGGRAENKKDEGVAQMAITIATDRRIENIKRNQKAVGQALKNSGEITQDIIYELYLRENGIYNTEGVAQKAHISVSQVRRKRNKFFELVAEERGLA